MSSEGIMALMQANTRAVEFSNRAFQAVRLSDHQTAVSLHRQALALKLKAYPETSVQAALTFNGLGESLIALGEFLAAEEVLSKALRVYDYEEYGGLGQGPRFDAAVARENMAQVREAQGRFADAVELRKRGKTRGQICCPNMQRAGCFFCRASNHALDVRAYFTALLCVRPRIGPDIKGPAERK
ncbi:hypothetical protein SISNIDRAFT_486504 [Sistotremastrum niveocremeum HHB9708]|uniref:TPR-like protein n=1 Tax=Sistotremastrum niveocremeum HHB9708 TaxID=1314777 RepID=A0A164TLP9_9AGAM|nr:hypothetical protein SISNIDRAFT_486504 [Sistotremastrum niveocremeum HHB9708]